MLLAAKSGEEEERSCVDSAWSTYPMAVDQSDATPLTAMRQHGERATLELGEEEDWRWELPLSYER